MKINFNIELRDIDNKPIKTTDDKKAPSATLGFVCINALMATYQDEQSLGGEKKLERFLLAKKIKRGGEMTIKAEEIALLKELIGKGYSALIVGVTTEVLDPPEKVK